MSGALSASRYAFGEFFSSDGEAHAWLPFEDGATDAAERLAYDLPDHFREWQDWRDGRRPGLGFCRFYVWERPAGENDEGMGSVWVRRRAIFHWRVLLAGALDAAGLERPIRKRGLLYAHAVAQFRVNAGQEPENFRGVFSKALGDALTMGSPVTGGPDGGWLPGGYRGDGAAAWRFSFDHAVSYGRDGVKVVLLWVPDCG